MAATRKVGLSGANARAQVFAMTKLATIIIDADMVLGAIDLHETHRISFWDALVVKSAATASCRVLYAEDLGHGQVLDSVRIVDPFARKR